MAQRFYLPRQQVFTDLAAVGAGWKLESFETGTTTPLATFSDTALTVANTNPIIADSAGRLPDIFVNDLKLYKFILSDDSDVLKWTADPADPKVFSLNDFDPRPTSFWGTTAGTAAAYTLVADPTLSAYSSTNTFFAAVHLANTAAPTMAIDGLTALNLKKSDGAGGKVALEANDVVVSTYEFRNDGTDIIVLNPEKPYINIDRAVSTTGLVNITYGTDADHDIDFSAGATNSSDDTVRIISTASTKQLDATWAAGTAAGGLADALTIANNTLYFCYALSSANGRTVDFGFDTSVTATNLLADTAVIAAGLTKFVRVGSIKTDGSANILSTILGRVTATGQTLYFETGEEDDTTLVIPFDDTIPQSGEGKEFITLDFAALDSTKRLLIDITFMVSGSSIGVGTTVALFKNSETDSFSAGHSTTAADHVDTLRVVKDITAGSTATITFKVRFGATSSTSTINGISGSRRLGGIASSTIRITEY